MDPSDNAHDECIAIVGMAGYFPGAGDVEEFWENIKNSVESVRSFTEEELAASGVDLATLENPLFVNAGAVMDGANCFDADFFGINDKEAEMMDPQHRIFLEIAWSALEHSGHDPETYPGLIGVFGGVAYNTYLISNLANHPEIFDLFGHHTTKMASATQHAVTRVAYKLNLKGPAVGVNTACSTSGVALHLACQSVLSGECEMALVGGARVKVPQTEGYLYEEGGILSPDGHCRAFDEKAEGTIVGSGGCMLVIKRLSDALEDGNTVYATVKGSAINNDGAEKIGYTAPSRQGQEAVIKDALAMAEIDPASIGLVEAHGTGTSLGDPIEISALTRAYSSDNSQQNYCAIGSVKTNIGHLDAGACAAGVIKTAFALKYKVLPPTVNYEHPNPNIDFANSPFYVNTTLRKWEASPIPRRAGVSSFGMGGTNAHIILEEAPSTESSNSRSTQLLVLSAKTSTSLEAAARNIASYLQKNPDLELSDVAYTLKMGRRRFRCRKTIVCNSVEEASRRLRHSDEYTAAQVGESRSQDLVFIFTGQGSQYANMGRGLYESEAVFREQVDYCSELLQPRLGFDLRTLLYPDAEKTEWAVQELKKTIYSQPALFVTEYALARLWMAWGLTPDAMIGHSIGEYVAACLSGVFTLEDSLELVSERGRLMQSLPGGSMLAVLTPEKAVQKLLKDNLSVAAVNSPDACVVSGCDEAIADIESELKGRDIRCRRLNTSHAFHSAMLDPVLADFRDVVAGIERKAPRIPLISNLTGTWITDDEAKDSNYWVKHLRQTVRFSDGITTLLNHGDYQYLEVGPGNTLSMLATQHSSDRAVPGLSSLRHPKEQFEDLEFALKTLGEFWLRGFDIDWAEFYRAQKRQRIPLPTYVFDRKKFWIESHKQRTSESKQGEVEKEHAKPKLPSRVESVEVLGDKESIIRDIKAIIVRFTGLEHTDIDVNANFLELGLDSLLMTKAIMELQAKFRMKLKLNQLFEELSDIKTLSSYIYLKRSNDLDEKYLEGSSPQSPRRVPLDTTRRTTR